MAPSLIEMPEVVMKNILGEMDYPDVQSLRRTCHDLRNLIDDIQPDPKILRLVIIADVDSIDFKLNFDKSYDQYPEGRSIRVKYTHEEVGPELQECHVEWFRSDGKKKKILEKIDFVDQFCRDCAAILQSQKSQMEDFILNFDYFSSDSEQMESVSRQLLPTLESILKNRPRPLSVENFHTVVYKQSQVLHILPYLAPKNLKKISITHRRPDFIVDTWNIDRLIQLEQWKCASECWIIDVKVRAGIQNFSHFEDLCLDFGEITVDDLIEWKETILTSPKMKTGRITFETCDGEEHFNSTYGPPVTDTDKFGDNRRSWFFEVPDKKLALRMSFYKTYFRFAYVELKKVPSGVLW